MSSEHKDMQYTNPRTEHVHDFYNADVKCKFPKPDSIECDISSSDENVTVVLTKPKLQDENSRSLQSIPRELIMKRVDGHWRHIHVTRNRNGEVSSYALGFHGRDGSLEFSVGCRNYCTTD